MIREELEGFEFIIFTRNTYGRRQFYPVHQLKDRGHQCGEGVISMASSEQSAEHLAILCTQYSQVTHSEPPSTQNPTRIKLCNEWYSQIWLELLVPETKAVNLGFGLDMWVFLWAIFGHLHHHYSCWPVLPCQSIEIAISETRFVSSEGGI